MPSAAVQNPPAQTESKSAKKKKAAKAGSRVESPAPTASPATERAVSVAGAYNNPDDTSESAYIRELAK